MELKDVILSTLAEMENEEHNPPIAEEKKPQTPPQQNIPPQKTTHMQEAAQENTHHASESELLFLQAIRERLLVLFEGFQAPNNANLEAKIDMTLNFLEYTLATIDERIEQINKDKML